MAKVGLVTDLSEANLSYAKLSKADLSNANLSKADLRLATLTEADLRWGARSHISGRHMRRVKCWR